MKNIFIAVSLSSIFLVSCADNSDRKNLKDKELEEEAVAPIKEHMNKAYYPIPSPEQMFGFINDNGVGYDNTLLNDVSNSDSYIDPNIKALNFGVFTADLAYAAAYHDIESTISLYKTVKKLGAELNIAEMMSDEMMEDLQSNMENPDSLAVIAGDSYYQAVEFLESNGQEGKLALMSVGGWVESMYITTNAIKEFEPNSITIDRIASQKITFGNLYTYLKKNEEKAGVEEQIKKIQPVRAVFASLLEENSAQKKSENGGKLVLGRGKKIKMTQEQFVALKDAVNEYRTYLIGKK